MNICSEKCFGSDGYDGSCCKIESRDYIIGPHKDAQEFLDKLALKLKRKIPAEEVFITYQEGRKLFPEKLNWQKPEAFPALRLQMHHPKYPCIFYNDTLKQCTVYDIRPQICCDYVCDFLAQSAINTPEA